MTAADHDTTTTPPDIDAILADPATSHFLRYAVLQLLARDPVDALRDVEILLACASRRAKKALAQPGGSAS